MNVKQALLEKFQDGSFALCTSEQIAAMLRLRGKNAAGLNDILLSLCRGGELLSDSRSRFGTAEQFGAKQGVFQGNERGFGFVCFPDGSPDLFIPRRGVCGALHGDVVLAFCSGGRSEDEGEILAVLERGCKTVVGVYRREGQAGYLVPDDRRLSAEIFIPAGKHAGAKSGAKAVAQVRSFEGRTPVGEIAEVLGREGDLFTEELAIIRAHKLHEKFPADAEAEGKRQAARPITEKDLYGREDLRKKLVITVDGEDTRDIDDAISIERREGRFYLGVHIADVSHYVARGSRLDEEALSRGTSVYFPDRVLPMLPKELSNGICSLNEGEDRLTLSCFMTVDGNGRVTAKRVCPSVIRSRHRMTYTDVTKIAEGDPEAVKKYPDLTGFVAIAAELTRILQRAREARGGIALDVKEAKILYRDGKISIPDYERTISHEMIEEFMVLANESVATLMTEKNVPFVYRIHERPTAEKAQGLLTFLAEAGIKAELDAENVTPRHYAALLKRTEGSPLYPLVNRVMLRSMMKARYSPENAGHFGLASACYCHFTSPIRRYPDLCVHRIVKEALSDPAGTRKFAGFVEEASVRSSECERNAADAEREADALYTVEYMQDKTGQRYEATISGANSYGLFAELKNTVEGFIPVETLPDDYYEYLEDRHMLRGLKHSYMLGERVRVEVTGVDRGMRRTNFALLEKIGSLK